MEFSFGVAQINILVETEVVTAALQRLQIITIRTKTIFFIFEGIRKIDTVMNESELVSSDQFKFNATMKLLQSKLNRTSGLLRILNIMSRLIGLS